jgi:hypothetical protein
MYLGTPTILGQKSEIRSPKSETTSNSEEAISETHAPSCLVVSAFGFGICFEFRVSDFGFSHRLTAVSTEFGVVLACGRHSRLLGSA